MAMKVMTSQTCIASPVISQIILPGMRQEEVRNRVDGRFRLGNGSASRRWPCSCPQCEPDVYRPCQYFLGCLSNLKHAMAAYLCVRVWIDRSQASTQGFISKARTLLAGPLWLAFFLSKCNVPAKFLWLEIVFLCLQILVNHSYPSYVTRL